tara:strand:- start:1660 stop:2370 length:711 start_codon:yes stop_codon:yes gene_type:complete
MPRKKKSKIYFGKDVQDAIVRYNLSEDDDERNIIYRDEIHKAFDKLCENIINTFKFTYFDVPFEDIKNEVISNLVINIHKYDHTKGSKAFSYFSVVAKNYLILHNNNNYKKYKTHDNLSIIKDDLELQPNLAKQEYLIDLTNELIRYLDENIPSIFKKKKDINIAYAIVELMKKREDIENFNKKCLYLLVREMTDVKTSDITKVTNILRKRYKDLVNEYEINGLINGENKKHSVFF